MTAAISTETMTGSTPTTVTAPKARRANSRLNVITTERRHVPKPSGRPDPTAHLSAADVEALARELDALRQEVLGSRGTEDAAYIRKLIAVPRKLELGSRAVLLFSLFPPAWLVGTAGLAVAKILENMEIGHNVLHGQWDWMRDPKIHSAAWERDHALPADLWKRSHNEIHHRASTALRAFLVPHDGGKRHREPRPQPCGRTRSSCAVTS
jgi:NADPH-dependent stearoyl-CoA 9-desaturase